MGFKIGCQVGGEVWGRKLQNYHVQCICREAVMLLRGLFSSHNRAHFVSVSAKMEFSEEKIISSKIEVTGIRTRHLYHLEHRLYRFFD